MAFQTAILFLLLFAYLQNPVHTHTLQMPLLRAPYKHPLTFISPTRATLYHNARPIAQLPRGGKKTFTPRHPIRPGDILTILAYQPTAPTAKHGVRLICTRLGTSPSTWRATFATTHTLRRSRKWQFVVHYAPICHWKPAISSTGSTGSSVPIWPKGRGSRGALAAFRTVVGGADVRLCKKEEAWLSIAATDRAWVFVNGWHVLDVHAKNRPKKVEVRVGAGDVISVKAMDVTRGKPEFGFAVDLRYKGRHVSTGVGRGPWRVIGMYKTEDKAKQFAFMRRGFDDCAWKYGAKPRYDPTFRSGKLPFGFGAQYVWAADAQKVGSVVFGRMVVDSDEGRCGDEIKGQGEDVVPDTCPCAEEPSSNRGICYYIKDWQTHTCDSRPCELRYVCIGGKTAMSPGQLLCIRKEVSHRIVPKRDDYGYDTQYCRLEASKHIVYIPYGRREE